jgi:hypothetical protein
MKISMTRALLGVAALVGVACGSNDGESNGDTVALAQAPARTPAQASEAAIQVEAAERAAFESGRAAEGEAFLQPVPPELERELEAGYQASLRQRHEEKALRDEQQANPATDVPVTRVDHETTTIELNR